MEEKIKQEVRLSKIREMKKPTILMNETDFENFKNEVESKVVNLKLGDNPKYAGIPIKTCRIVEKGTVIVYDDWLNSWIQTKLAGLPTKQAFNFPLSTFHCYG